MKDRAWRRLVIRRLADAVHTLRDHRFIHGDLKWRNILVETGDDPKVFVIDCPLGRKLMGPFLRRGMIKDMACLDKIGRRALSRTDRLRFYLRATGRQRLDGTARRDIVRITRFFEGRD